MDNGQGEIAAVYSPTANNELCDGFWHRITGQRLSVCLLTAYEHWRSLKVNADDIFYLCYWATRVLAGAYSIVTDVCLCGRRQTCSNHYSHIFIWFSWNLHTIYVPIRQKTIEEVLEILILKFLWIFFYIFEPAV